jgi:hypothetical protein
VFYGRNWTADDFYLAAAAPDTRPRSVRTRPKQLRSYPGTSLRAAMSLGPPAHASMFTSPMAV